MCFLLLGGFNLATWEISGKGNELYFRKNYGLEIWMNESQRDSGFF